MVLVCRKYFKIKNKEKYMHTIYLFFFYFLNRTTVDQIYKRLFLWLTNCIKIRIHQTLNQCKNIQKQAQHSGEKEVKSAGWRKAQAAAKVVKIYKN